MYSARIRTDVPIALLHALPGDWLQFYLDRPDPRMTLGREFGPDTTTQFLRAIREFNQLLSAVSSLDQWARFSPAPPPPTAPGLYRRRHLWLMEE